jgi:ArsR family transcriptional regulator
MIPAKAFDADGLGDKAEQVAVVLKALANGRRLLILCKLAETGTLSVTELAADIGLSQSALSQHLALMRDEGLVGFERHGQTLRYHIADRRVEALLETLYRLYCAEPATHAEELPR